MKIQFIYSFKDNAVQKINNYPCIPLLLQDEATLIDFATTLLTPEEIKTLVKITCTVSGKEVIQLPQWFKFCKGIISSELLKRDYAFITWLMVLQKIAELDMPNDYKPGDKWHEPFWKTKYYDKGISAQDAWKDYTTMIY